MTDIFAIATLMLWPVIPLFWIPVHFATRFFRRFGLLTYLMPAVTWLPLAYLIYVNRMSFLNHKIDFPAFLNMAGFPLLIAGTFLHLWTIRLLGGLVIIGVPEVSSIINKHMIIRGPFSIVRHPTYLAHTLIFSGVFFITGVTTVGAVALADFIIVNAVLIPLEEKELASRFGEEYKSYKRKVTASFFPGFPR
jgi:protein-S-isoprenylcysteine O-methyltransferase Ste14